MVKGKGPEGPLAPSNGQRPFCLKQNHQVQPIVTLESYSKPSKVVDQKPRKESKGDISASAAETAPLPSFTLTKHTLPKQLLTCWTNTPKTNQRAATNKSKVQLPVWSPVAWCRAGKSPLQPEKSTPTPGQDPMSPLQPGSSNLKIRGQKVPLCNQTIQIQNSGANPNPVEGCL